MRVASIICIGVPLGKGSFLVALAQVAELQQEKESLETKAESEELLGILCDFKGLQKGMARA